MITAPEPIRWDKFLFTLLVTLALTSLAFLYVAPGIRGLQRLQVQKSIQARYGATTIQRCKAANITIDNPVEGSWPAHLRTIAIDSATLTINPTYDQAIPDQWHATGSQDINAVMCLVENKTLYAEDTYALGDICHRYRHDLSVFMMDPVTGGLIRTKTFSGLLPPPCPEFTYLVVDEDGTLPNASNITTWLNQSQQTYSN